MPLAPLRVKERDTNVGTVPCRHRSGRDYPACVIDYRQIAARIYAALEEKGWSVRELGRRSGMGDSARAGNAIRNLENGGSTKPANLTAFATALGVSEEWLIHGRGEGPAPMPRIDPPAHVDEGDDVRPDLPPGCLAQNPGHQRSKKVARRLAPDIEDEWVWEDLDTVDTLFLGTREPSPQVLADLARLIQKHGKPR